MILAGRLLLPDDADGVELAAGTVELDGDTIAAVNVGDTTTQADAGGPDALICPAFTDTHLHLPQFDQVGAHVTPLLRWLQDVTFPNERRWENTGFARGMAERVVGQLLSVGTSGVAAYATVHAEGTRAALEVFTQRGFRGVIGQTLIDREAPDYLCRPADQLLDETAALLDKFSPGQRMSAAVTPRFAITCTAPLLEGAGRLAAERHAAVQSHLAETVAECDFVGELFGGKRYVDVYRDAGLLRPGSLWGHGIHLDDADRVTLRGHDAVVAHCPTANSFLRSGSMPWREHHAADVAVSLGSDIGGGYERSMVRVARAMIETAAARGDAYPTAAQAWRQITAGNAELLPGPDGGVLLPGATADVLVIEPDVPWLDHPDPLAMLLWAWDDRWLERTVVRGEVGYAAG
ncbi:MAG: amidohydrolase family protein [Planctomycetota bacterium]